MAGAFPEQLQARDRQPDALGRDVQAVRVAQELLQEWSCPHGGLIAPVARVVVEHRLQQWVDDALGCRGTAAACAVGQALVQGGVPAALEALDPVVDGLAADAQALGHLLGVFAVVKPEQRQGTAEFRGLGGMADQVLQEGTVREPEIHEGHRYPSCLGRGAERLL